MGDIIASEPICISWEVEDKSSNLHVSGSDEARVISDWDGLDDFVSGNQASQDVDSGSSEASLPDTASSLGKSLHNE